MEEMIKERIQSALKQLNQNKEVHLTRPSSPSFGDYTTNIAMQLAKELKKNPFEVAQEIANHLQKGEIIEKIDVVRPGFINIWISKDYLKNQLISIIKNDGTALPPNGKQVVVEYSSPNIAKPFTIGHLRSTIIGDAIANLLQATGWKVYRDNHLGDWGTQFGKQIYAIKTWGNEAEIEKSARPVKLLVELYVKFHSEAEKNPEIENEGRKWFKKLEEGDAEARRLWQKCIEWSLKEFEEIYKKLGVTFTENPSNGHLGYGESFFEDKMGPVIQELKNKDVLKESKGAQLVFYPNDKYPPLMIIKDDGATLYSTRDLATDKFRLNHYGKDIVVVNEVGAEQSLYFQQIYELEQMLGWYKPGQRIHVGHGMYRFKDKKMSTRKGNVIWLEDVLEEAIRRATNLKKETAGETQTSSQTSEAVGIGAIKWNDLKRTARQDVIFDWDDILNMQGDSGPYMQYTYVRALSILNKEKPEVAFEKIKTYSPTPEELELLRTLTAYQEAVLQAAERFAPHILTTYLYNLAQNFNLFYQKNPILKADEETKNFRLLLTAATSQTIKNGLHLLGIETVEKM